MEKTNYITDLERQIAAISIPDFDADYLSSRRTQVRQRMVLGLVDMFEAFPQVKAVLVDTSKNILDMFTPVLGPEASDKERQDAEKKVKNFLRKTRDAINSRSRDTKWTLSVYFTQLRTDPKSIDCVVQLPRNIFARKNLPVLSDPEIDMLRPEHVASLLRDDLTEISETIREGMEDISRPRAPKM